MKKIIAAIVALVIVAAFGYTHRDQVQARFSCADKIAHQFASARVVSGAYGCLDPITKAELSFYYNVTNAKLFAEAIGYDGSYSYLGVTNDGGYTYRLDWAGYPHNVYSAALTDLQSGDLKSAWSELNGKTQGWQSSVMTFYLFPAGSLEINTVTHQMVDVSGELDIIR